MATFLVVDDDASTRVTLSALLELEGHEVEHAASAAEARRALGGPSCDVVVLDRRLGDGDGASLVPVVRARWPRAKVLVMSGSLGATEAVPAGADAAFVKGESFDELLPLLERLLAAPRG